jgi:hypothetical protein
MIKQEKQATFQSILAFMESEDPNGTWYEATEWESAYILATLQEWLDDGLELTPRVQEYIDYLKSI